MIPSSLSPFSRVQEAPYLTASLGIGVVLQGAMQQQQLAARKRKRTISFLFHLSPSPQLDPFSSPFPPCDLTFLLSLFSLFSPGRVRSLCVRRARSRLRIFRHRRSNSCTCCWKMNCGTERKDPLWKDLYQCGTYKLPHIRGNAMLPLWSALLLHRLVAMSKRK